MSKPFEVSKPEEILTPEVVANLRLAFDQFQLSLRHAFVKLASGDWQQVSFEHENVAVEPRLCSYLRETKPFSDLCTQDHTQCPSRAMPKSGEVVDWFCPYGLRVMAVGFRVGGAEVVLRSTGWMEHGNEGFVITRIDHQLEKLNRQDVRKNVLALVRELPDPREAEFRTNRAKLKALLALIRTQAQAVYERNLEKSREDLLEKLRGIVFPLMETQDEALQGVILEEALCCMSEFYSLHGCALFFSDTRRPETLRRISDYNPAGTTLPQHINLSDLTIKSPPSIGSEVLLASTEYTVAIGHDIWSCLAAFPKNICALLVVWPRPQKDGLLDQLTFSHLTRTLAIPLCVSSLGKTAQDQIDLNLLQAKNTAHTVRSMFHAVMGESGDLVDALRDTIPGQLPRTVNEPLEHLQEQVEFIDMLLRANEIVEQHFFPGTRSIEPGEPKAVNLAKVLTNVRDSFKKRAEALRIHIVLERSATMPMTVEGDESAIALGLVLLVANALKFSHKGTRERFRIVSIDATEDSDFVYLTVSDFGIGIHPLEENSIFRPYVQGVVKDLTRPISGQGIGLTAGRIVAQLHGGDVTLLRCQPRTADGESISWSDLTNVPPASQRASEMLQHCVVTFQMSLRKKTNRGK